MNRGGIQRGGWWNRLFLSSAEDILSLLSRGSSDTSKAAENILRYYRIRYWQRYHGYPKGEENFQHQIDKFAKLIGFKHSFKYLDAYVWVVWYEETRYFILVREKSLSIACNPSVPAKSALSFMYVMFIRLLWHLFNRQTRRDS